MVNIGFPARYVKILFAIYLGLLPILLEPSLAIGDVDKERILSFYNTHTHEHLTVIYKRDGDYMPKALKKINTILRDHRSGDIFDMDPNLLDYLYRLHVSRRLALGLPLFQAFASSLMCQILEARKQQLYFQLYFEL